jgi:formylglycine-generating enzyme required for sulfatase activity
MPIVIPDKYNDTPITIKAIRELMDINGLQDVEFLCKQDTKDKYWRFKGCENLCKKTLDFVNMIQRATVYEISAKTMYNDCMYNTNCNGTYKLPTY